MSLKKIKYSSQNSKGKKFNSFSIKPNRSQKEEDEYHIIPEFRDDSKVMSRWGLMRSLINRL